MNNIKPALILLFLVIAIEKTKAQKSIEALLSEYTAAYFKFREYVPSATNAPSIIKGKAIEHTFMTIQIAERKKIKDSLWKATIEVKNQEGWPKSHVAMSVNVNEINGNPQFTDMYTGDKQDGTPTQLAKAIISEINFGLTNQDMDTITEIAKNKGAGKLGCEPADIVLKAQLFEVPSVDGQEVTKNIFFIMAQETPNETV